MRPLTPSRALWGALGMCIVFAAACERGGEAVEPTSGEATSGKPTPEPASSVFTKEQASNIEVASGSTFSIKLESNPALPLVWKLDGLSDDVIAHTKMENVDAKPGDCDGCGGFDIWHFTANAPGESDFSLTQTHVGKPDEPPIQSVPVHVLVR